MAKGKPYRRLSLKLLAMLLLAAMAAIALGLTLQVLGDYLVERVYCSEKRQNLRLLEAIGSFRTYVQEEAVSSTNVQKIGVWNHSHPYIQLTVSANGAILNSDRWGAEMVGSDGGFVIRSGKNQEKISSSANSAEHTFPVNFTDGSYQVEIQDFSQNQLYALVSWASLAAGGIIFLALMLLYNSQVTSSISRLAKQVRQVSKGDLTLEITPSSKDEIGDLAEDVDAMRLSIMDKLQREELAWRANTELITAISHDVRTPLTTLMGYLDILGESDNLTPSQRQEYLSVCRHSMIAALPSLEEPIKMDSETNVFRFCAMAKASSIVDAYCRISLVRMEIGVAEPVGTADLAALIVTVSPVSFMPDSTPIIPGHPTEANL